MKKKIFTILGAAGTLAAVVLSSCSRDHSLSYNETEQALLDAWMTDHVKDPEVVRQPIGYYLKIVPGNRPGALKVADYAENVWVKVRYIGYTLDGRPFVNYYKDYAVYPLNTFSYYTHYVPQYTKMVANYNITPSQYDALMQMQEGDSAVIYSPSSRAYGNTSFTGQEGFAGTTTLEAFKPVHMTMKLEQVVPDPLALEVQEAAQYAGEVLSLPANDTLSGYGLYFRTLKACPDSSAITADSTVYINYIGRFLDGFVLDTNLPGLAKERHIYNSDNNYSPLEYKPREGSLVQAFYKVVPQMRYGEIVEMVFISRWGYGSSGSFTGKTIVNPYTPLVFKFQVQRGSDYTYDMTTEPGKP